MTAQYGVSHALLCTGSTGEERQRLREIVGQLGGRYSGSFQAGRTTHLVCAATPSYGAHTEKMRVARQSSGCLIVTTNWLLDSAAEGWLLPEGPYLMPGSDQAGGNEEGAPGATWSVEKMRHHSPLQPVALDLGLPTRALKAAHPGVWGTWLCWRWLRRCLQGWTPHHPLPE